MKMDIKQENDETEADTEETHTPTWFEVPIECSNSPHIKQEFVEDGNAFVENISIMSCNIKAEAIDYKEEIVEDTETSIKLEYTYDYSVPTSKENKDFIRNESEKSPENECQLKILDMDKNIDKNRVTYEFVDPFFKKAIIKLDKMTFHRSNFICDVCFRYFPSLDSLKKHKLYGSKSSLDGESKRFLCKDCCFRTNHLYHFNCHKTIHTGKRPFKCTECTYKFSQASTLKKHMMTHTGEKPFKCTDCEYKCTSSSNLKKHLLIHAGKTPFNCQECYYKCTNSSSLKKHMMIHNNDKPYECDICGYKCTLLTYLKIHKKIHGGDRTFKCNVCEYQCLRSSDLKKHKYVHMDHKPFKCAICDFACINAAYLKTHSLIHTGEKPFECDICEYKCTQVSSLKRHKKSHDKIVRITD